MEHGKDPLLGPPPPEVPLPRAPLVLVIAQVRFSPILAIQNGEFIASFQEAIRPEYPILRQEQSQGIAFGPDETTAGPRQSTWRFSDKEHSWRVSLAPQFVALETKTYSSRRDFLDRLESIVGALEESLEPAVVQRFGIRYIDRIEGTALEIDKLVRQEMLGIMTTCLSNHVEHSLSEALLDIPQTSERLRLRWGHIPPNGTVDPSALESIEEPSWVLDLDMFSVSERPFTTDGIIADAGRYTERLYALFRWAVTEEFLRRYGGEP